MFLNGSKGSGVGEGIGVGGRVGVGEGVGRGVGVKVEVGRGVGVKVEVGEGEGETGAPRQEAIISGTNAAKRKARLSIGILLVHRSGKEPGVGVNATRKSRAQSSVSELGGYRSREAPAFETPG